MLPELTIEEWLRVHREFSENYYLVDSFHIDVRALRHEPSLTELWEAYSPELRAEVYTNLVDALADPEKFVAASKQ
jgi:hypothetical protein